MLSAVLHGKKLGTGFAGTRLKIGETQGAEDVLTASVFERIGVCQHSCHPYLNVLVQT